MQYKQPKKAQKNDQFQQIKMQQQQLSESTVKHMINKIYHTSKRTINEVATNVVYKAKHSSCPFVHRKAIVLKKQSSPVYLLGNQYLYQDKDKFDQAFRSIIWICYREELDGNFGDVGWGCMIRVCQMVLAQVLRKGNPNKHVSEIIQQFSSSENALFRFDKICIQGKFMNRWTSSTEVLTAIQDLLKQQQKYKLNIQMYSQKVSIDDVEGQKYYPMLLVIDSRLGQDKIEQKNGEHLFKILQHKYSVGMISGIGGQAIYVVGFHDGQLIALDPHYVQSQNQGEKNYFNQVPRGVSLQKITPTVGFCFFFEKPECHREWIQDLAECCERYRPFLAIDCDEKYCQCICDLRHPKKQISDQAFEILQ